MAAIVQCSYCPAPHKNGICGECGIDLRKGPAGCKHCPGNLKPGDIVCLKCGMNLLTGQRIAQAREERLRREIPWTPIGIAAAVLIAVGFAVGLGYWLLGRNPLEEARRAAAAGRSLEAVQQLQSYLQTHQTNAEARAMLGQVHFQMGSYAEALSDFEAALAQAPKDEELVQLAAAAAAKLPADTAGQRQIAAFRRLSESQPDNPRYHYLLGMALGAAGDMAGQAQELQKAATAESQAVPARLQLGVTKALQGDAAGAQETLAAAAGGSPGDIAIAKAAVAGLQGTVDAKAWEAALDSPSEAQGAARLRLGATYLGEGQYELAIDALRPAATQAGADPGAQFLYAVALQGLKQDAEATVLLDTLSEGKTTWAGPASLQLAELMLAQGNTVRANEYLRRAGDKDKSARALTLEGRVRMAEQQPEESLQLFERAIAADPRYAPAHLERGLAMVARNDVDRGVHELEEYLRLARAHGDLPQLNELDVLVGQLRQTAPGAVPAQAKEAAAR